MSLNKLLSLRYQLASFGFGANWVDFLAVAQYWELV